MNNSPRYIWRWIADVPAMLQRKTSSGWFVPQIDGLRFVAIATVFFCHVIGYTANKLPGLQPTSFFVDRYNHFARGVQLFFVISGFVIAMPFVKRAREGKAPGSLKDFFLRRLTRLEPPFLVAMVLTAALLVLSHHSSVRDLAPHLLATCTYSHAIVYGSKSPIAYITWSLEIEIQFYLIAPLIMSVLRCRSWIRRVGLGALAIASVIAQMLLVPSHHFVMLSLIGYLPFFVGGIIVCDLAIGNDLWRNQRSRGWDALGCLAVVAGYSIPGYGLWESAAMPVLFATGVLSVFRGTALAKVMAWPWLTAVGGMCYSIYLIHNPLIYLFGHVTKCFSVGHALGPNLAIQTTLLALPVFVTCSLFFLAIEKPCMNKLWPHKLVQFVWPTNPKDIHAKAANV